MTFNNQSGNIRSILILSSFLIVSLILWNTYAFFQKFKEEERTKMQVWASAQKALVTAPKDADIELERTILASNNSNPMILVNIEGLTFISNFKEGQIADSLFIKKKITQFSYENSPIEITHEGNKLATLYYGNSEVLNKLKYYPLALLLIIILFGAVVYFFYRTSKASEQNKLWAGMAKETAHQIGTPLSSLLGWAEILKTENIDQSITTEIEKDISRLHIITERFSKIGSKTILEKLDVVNQTREAYTYIRDRSSKLIEFHFESPDEQVFVKMNSQLFSWTIENLVVNAIDAMKGKGSLKLKVIHKEPYVHIRISDTGKGIPKGNFQKIFDPGFTSKKRGWGLGLSLVRRIIEDYHNGKVKVYSSAINKGTTMQITLKTIE
ncbi:sensor histidine kinase [Ascidiimonas sp. W6]|uniref:sensor histidine kinase n=1 Tax=Ascidiimonas meishanensis TaxID=3128903 RepID=UPI0030EC9B61